MDLLFSIIAQQTAPRANPLIQLLPLVIIAVVFYFLILRPQRTQVKQQRALLDSLPEGDRIVTVGGVRGAIQSIDGQTMRLEVAPGVVMTFTKQAVARRMLEIDDEDFEQAESE